MIIVKYKKIMNKGEKKILVTEVKALTPSELPRQYLNGKPKVWLEEDEYGTWELHAINEDGRSEWLSEGSMYTPEDFNDKIALLIKCGNRLKEINNKIKEEAKKWVDGQVHTLKI